MTTTPEPPPLALAEAYRKAIDAHAKQVSKADLVARAADRADQVREPASDSYRRACAKVLSNALVAWRVARDEWRAAEQVARVAYEASQATS